jgi:hypothetical protein
MAAHDDKISNNRRRLFKALSAAPIVATLRPGEALANNSAYQCAMKLREEQVDVFKPQRQIPMDCSGTIGDECTADGLMNLTILYWNKGQIDRPPDSNIVCQAVWDALPDRIVQIPVSPGGSLQLVAWKDPTTGSFADQGEVIPIGSNVVGPDSSNNSLDIQDADGNSCFVLTSRTGLVPLIGRTTKDDDGFEVLGYPPQWRAAGSGTTRPRSRQGMSESCMHSFMGGGAIGMNP